MDIAPTSSTKKPFDQAVQEFDGLSKLFRQLVPFKDGIAELRRKKASFATIAELLKGEGVTVSYRTVARFYHGHIAGELRSRRKNGSAATAPMSNGKVSDVGTNGSVQSILQERRTETNGPWTPRKRGPRIPDSKNL